MATAPTEYYHHISSGSGTTSSTYTAVTPMWSDWVYKKYTQSVWGGWSGTSATSYSTTSTADDSTTNGRWYKWIDDEYEPSAVRSSELVVYGPEIRAVSGTQVTGVVVDEYRVVWSDWVAEGQRDRVSELLRNNQRDINAHAAKEQKQLAEHTAQDLLRQLITTQQFEQYKKTGELFIPGRQADYVLKKGGGVFKVDKHKDNVHSLCIHLAQPSKFPKTDNIIGLKLLLEANEEHFLKLANNHGLRREVDARRLRSLAI